MKPLGVKCEIAKGTTNLWLCVVSERVFEVSYQEPNINKTLHMSIICKIETLKLYDVPGPDEVAVRYKADVAVHVMSDGDVWIFLYPRNEVSPTGMDPRTFLFTRWEFKQDFDPQFIKEICRIYPEVSRETGFDVFNRRKGSTKAYKNSTINKLT